MDDVSLTIEPGQVTCLLGPSGCGKSTTLRIIGGFEKPTEGRVIFDGQDITDLPTHPAFDKIEREGTRGLAISYNKDRMNAGEVLAAVNAMGHGIVDVSTREADLEDVFLNLTRAANG